MTLHEAIEVVLKLKKRATAQEIADGINNCNLYVRKDGQPIPASQIHARVNCYKHLFRKDEEGFITLK